MLSFGYMLASDFPSYAAALFEMLAGNMRKIAPTGNAYEDDYATWLQTMTSAMRNECRRIVLIREEQALIGYFQDPVKGAVFAMEEVQFIAAWQGKRGLFRSLYGFVLPQLPDGITLVEAYANKRNTKSQAILCHLGLQVAGENASGTSLRFEGAYADLLEWYRIPPRID